MLTMVEVDDAICPECKKAKAFQSFDCGTNDYILRCPCCGYSCETTGWELNTQDGLKRNAYVLLDTYDSEILENDAIDRLMSIFEINRDTAEDLVDQWFDQNHGRNWEKEEAQLMYSDRSDHAPRMFERLADSVKRWFRVVLPMKRYRMNSDEEDLPF